MLLFCTTTIVSFFVVVTVVVVFVLFFVFCFLFFVVVDFLLNETERADVTEEPWGNGWMTRSQVERTNVKGSERNGTS